MESTEAVECMTPIETAAANKNFESVVLMAELLQQVQDDKVKLKKALGKPLEAATRNGDIGTMKTLINCRGGVDYHNDKKQTLLHAACESDAWQNLLWLIEK